LPARNRALYLAATRTGKFAHAPARGRFGTTRPPLPSRFRPLSRIRIKQSTRGTTGLFFRGKTSPLRPHIDVFAHFGHARTLVTATGFAPPCPRHLPPTVLSPERPMPPPLLPPLRLLIVDDDRDLPEALPRQFRQQGLTVLPAGDAEEALAK